MRPPERGLSCVFCLATLLLLLQSAALTALLLVPSGPLSLPKRASVQEQPTEIVVTNNSDDNNGDTSSVDALIANPGEDGISLREAIEATNNDSGTYTIRFDPALTGTAIRTHGLHPLTGGGVTIDGDIDGDGKPDVTVRPADDATVVIGFHIGSSSGNRLEAIKVHGGFELGADSAICC